MDRLGFFSRYEREICLSFDGGYPVLLALSFSTDPLTLNYVEFFYSPKRLPRYFLIGKQGW